MSVRTPGYSVYALAYNPILCFFKRLIDWFVCARTQVQHGGPGFLTRDRTEPRPFRGWSFNPWTTRKVPPILRFYFVPQNCFRFGHWAPSELTALYHWRISGGRGFSGLVWCLGAFFLPSTAGCFRHLLCFLASLLQSILFPRNPGSFSWIMLQEGNIWAQDVFAATRESLLLGPPSPRNEETVGFYYRVCMRINMKLYM